MLALKAVKTRGGIQENERPLWIHNFRVVDCALHGNAQSPQGTLCYFLRNNEFSPVKGLVREGHDILVHPVLNVEKSHILGYIRMSRSKAFRRVSVALQGSGLLGEAACGRHS